MRIPIPTYEDLKKVPKGTKVTCIKTNSDGQIFTHTGALKLNGNSIYIMIDNWSWYAYVNFRHPSGSTQQWFIEKPDNENVLYI